MEEKRQQEDEWLAATKVKMDRAAVVALGGADDVPAGMAMDGGESGDDSERAEDEVAVPKSFPKRKTKQQRGKAARIQAEVRPSLPLCLLPALIAWQKLTLAAKASRKRPLASVDGAKLLQLTVEQANALLLSASNSALNGVSGNQRS